MLREKLEELVIEAMSQCIYSKEGRLLVNRYNEKYDDIEVVPTHELIQWLAEMNKVIDF